MNGTGKATFQYKRHHAVLISSSVVSFIISVMKVLCLGTEELRHYCVTGAQGFDACYSLCQKLSLENYIWNSCQTCHLTWTVASGKRNAKWNISGTVLCIFFACYLLRHTAQGRSLLDVCFCWAREPRFHWKSQSNPWSTFGSLFLKVICPLS